MLCVTGITGHSGRWFIERLRENNYQGKVRCVVRKESNTSFLEQSGLNIEKVIGDLNDREFMIFSMSGVDTVLHIASIHFSRNVIDAAIKNKVKWAILVHTTGRFSNFKSAASEYIEIEDEILNRRNEIGITILRPTMIYGSSRDRNMYKLVDYLYQHTLFPMFGSGKNLMQPIHARDLGNAYYQVIINREKTFDREYDLSGANPLPYIDIVRTISKGLNRKNIIIKLPIWISVITARLYNVIDRKAIISVEQVLRMQEDKAFDYVDATRDFGYRPMSFEEGIIEEIAEYMSMVKKQENPEI